MRADNQMETRNTLAPASATFFPLVQPNNRARLFWVLYSIVEKLLFGLGSDLLCMNDMPIK